MLRYVLRAQERQYFPRPEEMPKPLHALLMQRGVASAAEAEAFLHPCEAQLHDPLRLSGMADAVARLRRAMDAGERICVYGDYDVDGVCASAILWDYLEECGANAWVYLPSRHEEGYGLNEGALQRIAEDSSLLVTVDCGIASYELIERAKALGMDCIVTDHHRPGALVPNCPVVNPLLADYPFPWLCGAGVAFKLVQALGGREAALRRIDLAAIATVADVVSLTGENRVIVRLGLDAINRGARPGVAALMENARIEAGKLSSEGVAFRIAPRLNAGGRLGSAQRSFDLLTQRDAFLAVAQADELEQENTRRKGIEQAIERSALEQLRDFDFCAHRILMVRGEAWNPGVIGLTASHLRERFHFPAIVFSENDGVLTGSCRSIEGVDIYQTLCAAAHLIEKFGGHAQAAGLTLRAENFDALQAALDAYLFENVAPDAFVPAKQYDLEVGLDECTEAFVRSLAAMEPTGSGNPEPVFRASAQVLEARAIGVGGAHLRLVCAQNGVRRAGIYFGAGEWAAKLGEAAEILFTPQLNLWNGRTDVQLRLCALRETENAARIAAAAEEECALQRKFLTELFYNRRISCTRAAPAISMAELRRRLEERMQGVWIVCAELDCARRILWEASAAPDLCIGAFPEDARAFNSLIVCPERTDAFPRALRTLVLAGVPAPDALPEGVEALALEVDGRLGEALPDIDQLRTVYRALRTLAKRPQYIAGMDMLSARLAQETGCAPIGCHAALLALMDMKLVAMREKPFGFALPAVKKADPQASAVWRAIQAWKDKSGGEGT